MVVMLMGRKNKSKPGILLYFDQVEAFEYFTDEEVGKVVRAALRFGQFGEDTTFPDRALQTVWHSIKLSVIRDQEAYFRGIASNTYSSMCNVWKDKGLEYPDKAEWIEAEMQRLLSNDAERNRTTPSGTHKKRKDSDAELQQEKSVKTTPARYTPTADENAGDSSREHSLSPEQEFEEKRKKALDLLRF